jgi:hypothetical protein
LPKIVTHQHRWIDISVLNEAFETRLCVECNMEQRRYFMTDEWIVTRTTLGDGTVLAIEDPTEPMSPIR